MFPSTFFHYIIYAIRIVFSIVSINDEKHILLLWRVAKEGEEEKNNNTTITLEHENYNNNNQQEQ